MAARGHRPLSEDPFLEAESFAPVIGQRPSALILGSMPGRASLDAQRYYAHPRNAFWPILGAILGFDAARTSYAARLHHATDAGIALWDAARRCRRPGSLDADMRDVEPNDLLALLAREPGIRLVACNGAKSHELVLRWFGDRLDGLPAPPQVLRLPSTSPANAGTPFAAKLATWHAALAAHVRVPGAPSSFA